QRMDLMERVIGRWLSVMGKSRSLAPLGMTILTRTHAGMPAALQAPKQAALQRLVSMNRNRKTNHAAGTTVDVMAIVDSKQCHPCCSSSWHISLPDSALPVAMLPL